MEDLESIKIEESTEDEMSWIPELKYLILEVSVHI